MDAWAIAKFRVNLKMCSFNNNLKLGVSFGRLMTIS